MIADPFVGTGMLNFICYPSAGQTGLTILIYTGTAPTHADNTATGTLLSTCTQVGTFVPSTNVSYTIFNTMVAGSGVCFQQASATATGTAGYWRLMKGAQCYLQGSVGVGTGDLQLNSLAFNAGQQVTITAFQISISGIF